MPRLLALLALAAVLCLPLASAAAYDDYGGASSGTPAEVSPEDQAALRALLPPGGFYGALALQEPVRFYDPGNLYDYINGQAEHFISYEFKTLISATYEEGDDFVVVDVYDMAKPINAFGLYSTFRAPSNEFAAIGEQGFATSEGFMFWKGPMVVKVTADYADEDDMAKAAQAASKAVAALISADRAGLEILSMLPAAGKIENSDKYVRAGVLGQGFLSNGVVADYRTKTGSARLFLCELPDEDAARAAYAEYRKFAAAYGEPVEVESKEEFTADVRYYGVTTVILRGPLVAGGVGLPADAAPLMADLKAAVEARAAALRDAH